MFARIFLYACCLYYLTVGATFTGIVQPQFRVVGLIGVIGIGVLWLIGRRRWSWYRTALDTAILVWIAAFGLTLIANLPAWRRIAMGGWYVGVYLLIWYMLHDLLAHRVLTRRVLSNAVLLTGALIIAFGYLQARTWFFSTVPLILNGTLEFSLPRPVSTFGNPNTLGAYLAVLLPFALEAVFSSKSFTRILMIGYTLLVGGLLLLTYSRGAWIGAAAGVGAYLALWIWRRGWLSPSRWREFWRTRTTLARIGIGIAGAVILLIGIAGFVVIARTTLAAGGRSGETRTWIYNTAVQMFTAQPITGAGLFTFGVGLAQYNGTPPFEPHAHAHNIVLHVAAELGIVGLIALALTVIASVRAMFANRRGDPVIVAGIGAVMAFGVHQLVDVTVMTPAIAVICLIAVVIAVAPQSPVPMGSIQRNALRIAVPVGIAALAVTGIWSNLIYQRYTSIIGETVTGAISPLEGAERLQSVVDADPSMSIYLYEQGVLYGLAGDTEAAIRTFEQYTQLEPYYGMGWANLLGLYMEAGEIERANDALRRAPRYALVDAPTRYRAAIIYAANGDIDAAREHYWAALLTDPDLQLIPSWDDDPIRASLLDDAPTVSGAGQTIRLLQAGDIETARQVWAESNYRSITPSLTSAAIIDVLLALHSDDWAAAENALQAAERQILNPADVAWLYFGRACLARYDGDESAVLDGIAAAHAALEVPPFGVDWNSGANIGYTQLMRMVIPRMYVPQVEYPIASSALRALLDGFTVTPETRFSSCP